MRDLMARLPALCLLFGASAVFAADERPVAKVGTETVSAEALTRRLARMPQFQRAALASDPSQLKKLVLEGELVPDVLYAAEATRLQLEQRPVPKRRLRELLRDAMDRELKRDALGKAPVTDADVRAYFDENRSRFEIPKRLRIWRILVDDEALAKKILAESKGTDGIKRWSDYARESSLDKATHLRNGDLGFVRPDGSTDVPTVRVDPAVFAAVDGLADGELLAEPIKSAGHLALLWRRGSLKPMARTIAQETGSIRQVLERKRVEEARTTLLASLREKYVTAPVNEAALETFKFDAQGVPARQLTNRIGRPAAAGSSLPAPSERGER